MDIKKYSEYFQNMQPLQSIKVADFRDPAKLVEAGKLCIENGEPIMFSADYSIIYRLFEFPKDEKI